MGPTVANSVSPFKYIFEKCSTGFVLRVQHTTVPPVPYARDAAANRPILEADLDARETGRSHRKMSARNGSQLFEN